MSVAYRRKSLHFRTSRLSLIHINASREKKRVQKDFASSLNASWVGFVFKMKWNEVCCISVITHSANGLHTTFVLRWREEMKWSEMKKKKRIAVIQHLWSNGVYVISHLVTGTRWVSVCVLCMNATAFFFWHTSLLPTPTFSNVRCVSPLRLQMQMILPHISY